MSDLAPITDDTRFVSTVLHTDTEVYEIIGRTAQTLRLRKTRDAGQGYADLRADEGAYGLRPVFHPQAPDPDGVVKTVRLRKDGTYRVHSWSRLRPATTHDGVPVRYTDYRV